jgi:hypothetical protein
MGHAITLKYSLLAKMDTVHYSTYSTYSTVPSTTVCIRKMRKNLEKSLGKVQNTILNDTLSLPDLYRIMCTGNIC